MVTCTNGYGHCCYIVVSNTIYYAMIAGIILSWMCVIGIIEMLLLLILLINVYILILISSIRMHLKYFVTSLCIIEPKTNH